LATFTGTWLMLYSEASTWNVVITTSYLRSSLETTVSGAERGIHVWRASGRGAL
jgi:hypothetical protein